MVDLFRQWQKEDKPPSVIVVGSGLSTIRIANGSILVLNEYSMNITRLVQPIDKLRSKLSRVLWVLQAPVNEEKLIGDDKVITDEIIDQYNKAAVGVSL